MIYEYACDNGHITEKTRSVSMRFDAVVCSVCNKDATLAVSLPQRRPKYKGGIKVPGIFLPPTADGNIRPTVEVNSREEYKKLLKTHGLLESKTESDDLIQGGLEARQRQEAKTKAEITEASEMSKQYNALKANPEAARNILNKAVEKGKIVRDIQQSSLGSIGVSDATV